jgi:hypothetical protein
MNRLIFFALALLVSTALDHPAFGDSTYYQINFTQTSGDQLGVPTGSFFYDPSSIYVLVNVQWAGFSYGFLESAPPPLSGCTGSGVAEIFQLLSGGCTGGLPQWKVDAGRLANIFEILAPDGSFAFVVTVFARFRSVSAA